jgi:hypothetical protein
VEISLYITELLSGHDCVIIPGLGAFVATSGTAQIDENQEIIHPPSREISFDSKVKNDDGLLVAYVASGEGIPLAEARKHVEQFREDIQYRLEKGDSVVFPELGTLVLTEENQVRFHGEPGMNFLPGSYGLKSVSLIPDWEEKRRIQAFGKRKNRIWFLLVLIPVIAGGVWIFLQEPGTREEKEIPEIPFPGVVTDSSKVDEAWVTKDSLQEVQPSSTLPSDDVSETMNDSISIPETVPGDAFRYHLIGGSFKDPENAHDFLDKVKASGYQPVHLGKQGNFYIVAIGSYSSLQTAIAAKEEYLDRYPDSGVWIKEVEH